MDFWEVFCTATPSVLQNVSVAADSVLLNLLRSQFGPMISRALICQAQTYFFSFEFADANLTVVLKSETMIVPCPGYVCHICGQGKHIATTIHCVCVGCQILNMQNRGFCFIQEKSLNQVHLNDFPTVCKQLAPVNARASGVHDLIFLRLRASLTHFCFHVFHNRRELFIILHVLQIKTREQANKASFTHS